MNREILFRAKSSQSWCYGYVHKDYESPMPNKWRLTTAYGDVKVINSDTIGEWTGLLDKNNVMIFEGDILQVNYHGNEIGRVCIYYKYAMYLCDVVYGDVDFETLGMLNANYQLEVIGNVYDNKDIVDAREWSSDGEWLGDKA